MRTPTGSLRAMGSLLIVMAMTFALAACGGGGGGGIGSASPGEGVGGTGSNSSGSTSPGASGPATVSVSVASAPDFPAGTTFAPSTLSPVSAAAPANSPDFNNVFVTVTKLALIPSSGPEYPDGNGQLEQENSSGENGQSGMPGFVTIPLPHPVRFDLLHPPTGRQVAILLNKFSTVPVPAGEYSKIRVYYDNVVGHKNGVTPDTVFHPTAHYHFDVHFVGGNLVIPVDAPQVGIPQQEGIRFYSIAINIVGLKYHQAGNSGNVLLRPQVFAEFVPPVLYSVKGTADNVVKYILPNSVSGFFDVAIGGMSPVPATFDNNTYWAYSDDVLYGSDWMILDVFNQTAADAFRNRALVKVIGWFDSDIGIFRGKGILFSFPDVMRGDVANGWIEATDTFVLRLPSDNVVYPKPGRDTAYYDKLYDPHTPLNQAAIDNNVEVKARGYAFDAAGNPVDGIEAYWISIGP